MTQNSKRAKKKKTQYTLAQQWGQLFIRDMPFSFYRLNSTVDKNCFLVRLLFVCHGLQPILMAEHLH